MVFTQSKRFLLEREKHRTPASPDENWASHNPLLTGQSNKVFSVPSQFTLPSVYGPLPENKGEKTCGFVYYCIVLNVQRKMDKCDACRIFYCFLSEYDRLNNTYEMIFII